MTGRAMRERVIMHEDIGTMEADFSDLTFATVGQVDEFYDEADRRLEASGRRWCRRGCSA